MRNEIINLPVNKSIFVTIIIVIAFSLSVTGQEMKDRLDQKAEITLKSDEVLEQLIEISRFYKIPMGIEWVEPVDKADQTKPLPSTSTKPLTVKQLIQQIVKNSSGYSITFHDSFVSISQPAIRASPKNFLNLRIPQIRFKDSQLGIAVGELRQQIRITMNPEKYKKGGNGGYGYQPDAEGKERKLTINFQNATIREILNGLVGTHGNSTWVVRLVTTKEMKGINYYEQGPLNSGVRVTNDFYWQMINFAAN